jgi:hypothetical protein
MAMESKRLQFSSNGRCACAGRRLRYPLERDLAFRLECVGSMTNPLADEHECHCFMDGKRQRHVKTSCSGVNSIVYWDIYTSQRLLAEEDNIRLKGLADWMLA